MVYPGLGPFAAFAAFAGFVPRDARAGKSVRPSAGLYVCDPLLIYSSACYLLALALQSFKALILGGTVNLKNREDWLNEAVNRIRPWFEELEAQPPANVKVSTGWSRGAKKNQAAWCWKSSVASDGSSNIFVSPEYAKATDVLRFLTHELCHAADDCRDSHAGRFRRLWKAVGFEGKPTASQAGEVLMAKIEILAAELGEYPHAELHPGEKIKTQKTYMIKLECKGCGMIVRTTEKWLDQSGLPSCGCGEGEMVEAEPK